MLALNKWLPEKRNAEFGAFTLEMTERQFKEAAMVFCIQLKQKSWHARLDGDIHAHAIMDEVAHNAMWLEMADVNVCTECSQVNYRCSSSLALTLRLMQNAGYIS